MATLVQLRDLEGTDIDLAVVSGNFVDPDSVTVTEVVDARSLVALPGLADCHAHLSASSISGLRAASDTADLDRMVANGKLSLQAGVLLAADKGFKTDDSLRYLDVTEDDRPDMSMAGGIIASPGGYYDGFLEVEDGDLATAVAAKAASAAQWVKLVGDWPRPGRGAVPNFSEAAMRAAVERAHGAAKRVAIHTMAPETPGMAVRAGIDSIEHGIFMTDQDVDLLGARGGAWVPTIAAVETLVEVLGADSSGGRLLREGLGRLRDLLPGAPRRGVAVLAGTDLSLPHERLAVEAVRMVDYGMRAVDAVRSITSTAYSYLGRPAPLGPGGAADLIAVDGDPRDDITLLQRPRLVMRRGRVLRRE